MMACRATVKHAARRDWLSTVMTAASVLLIAAGVATLSWQPVLKWMESFKQSRAASTAIEAVDVMPRSKTESMVAAAVAYNEKIVRNGQPTVNDAFTEDAGTGSEYSLTLDTDGKGLMGRVRIPAIGVDLPIMHGTDSDTLDHNVGHVAGTSLPVGGKGTRTVLAAHNGLPTADLFKRLPELEKGDLVDIDSPAGLLSYRVTGFHVVAPSDVSSIKIVKGKDMVTLLTCTGMGNSRRLLVDAERVTPSVPAEEEEDKYDAAKARALLTGVITLGLLATAALATRFVRKRRHHAKHVEASR